MPNHCWNMLEVVDGDITDLEPFLERKDSKVGEYTIKEINLDLNKIIPMPPEYEESDRWYGWRVENWGTKWSTYEGQENGDGVSFSTAWGPPTPAIAALAKQINKSLRLVYDEPGMDFCGEFLADPDGNVVDNCYSGRNTAPDKLKEDLMIEDENDEEWS